MSQEAIDSAGSPYVATDIYNAKGELMATIPVGELSEKHGAQSYDMDRRKMISVMAEALPDGVIRTGCKVVDVEQDDGGATALLASGERVSGDVVVVAEGIHAELRERIAGPGGALLLGLQRQRRDPRRGSRRGRSPAITPRSGPAAQRAGSRRWRRAARAGTWSTAARRARSRRRTQLVEEARGWFEPLAKAIESTPEEAIQTHEAWDLPPLETWHDGRIVLIGDAAHATTPYAAMGACMAIKDGDVLAGLLAEKDSVDDAFEAFEAARKASTEGTVAGARKAASWAMMDSALGSWLRNEMMEHLPEKKARRDRRGDGRRRRVRQGATGRTSRYPRNIRSDTRSETARGPTLENRMNQRKVVPGTNERLSAS